jgi:uncharacterized protein YkwD
MGRIRAFTTPEQQRLLLLAVGVLVAIGLLVVLISPSSGRGNGPTMAARADLGPSTSAPGPSTTAAADTTTSAVAVAVDPTVTSSTAGPTTTRAAAKAAATSVQPVTQPEPEPEPPPVTTGPPSKRPLVNLPPVEVPPVLEPVSAVVRDTAAESTIASSFARHRAASGLPAVGRHGGLDGVAVSWARQLADRGDVAHNPNAGSQILNACGGECVGWAENVGVDSTASHAWSTFLGSGSHRVNIDDPRARYYGLGVIAADGMLWIVHVFGRG